MNDNIENFFKVIGAISSIITIISSIIAVILKTYQKTLFYIMETKMIFNIERNIENLSIKFKNENIKSLYVTKMAFWTSKNIKISGEELDENKLPCFYCNHKGKILFAEIIKDEKLADFSKANISLEKDDNLLIYFSTLDNDKGIVLSVISTLLPSFEPNLPNIHKIQKITPPKITYEIVSVSWFVILGIATEICLLLISSKLPTITFNSFDLTFIYVIFCVLSIVFCYILCIINLLKIIDYFKIPKQIRELFFRDEGTEK